MDLEIHKGSGLKNYKAPNTDKEFYYDGAKVNKAIFDLDKHKVRIFTREGEPEIIPLDDTTWNNIANSGSNKEAAQKAVIACGKIFMLEGHRSEEVQDEGEPELQPKEAIRKIDQLEMKIKKPQSELFKLDEAINDLESKHAAAKTKVGEIQEEQTPRYNELSELATNKNRYTRAKDVFQNAEKICKEAFTNSGWVRPLILSDELRLRIEEEKGKEFFNSDPKVLRKYFSNNVKKCEEALGHIEQTIMAVNEDLEVLKNMHRAAVDNRRTLENEINVLEKQKAKIEKQIAPTLKEIEKLRKLKR